MRPKVSMTKPEVERSISELKGELTGMENKKSLLSREIPVLEFQENELKDSVASLKSNKANLEDKAKGIIEDAEKKSKKIVARAEKKEAEAKVQFQKAEDLITQNSQAVNETRKVSKRHEDKIKELDARHYKLDMREQALDRRDGALDKRETAMDEREAQHAGKIDEQKSQISSQRKEIKKIERITYEARTTLSAEEAKFGTVKVKLDERDKAQDAREKELEGREAGQLQRDKELDDREKELEADATRLNEGHTLMLDREQKMDAREKSVNHSLNQMTVLHEEINYLSEAQKAKAMDQSKKEEIERIQKKARKIKK